MNIKIIVSGIIGGFCLLVGIVLGMIEKNKIDEIATAKEGIYFESGTQNFQKDGNLINLIGTYSPNFKLEAEEALSAYQEKYGKDKVQVIEYKGYIIIVPPTQKIDLITEAKREIDETIEALAAMIPSSGQQQKDIAKIRELFNTEGNITYNTVGGWDI